MKKIILFTLIIFTSLINNSDYCDGFEEGYCEGYKDVKGELSVCPVPPVCPVAEVGRDNYKGGYNLGFKKGREYAKEN